MRFVEKEDQLRFLRIAHFRQLFEKLGQHPQQKRGIQFRRANQFVGRQDVDHALPLRIRLHQVVEVQRRFAEEFLAALLLNLDQPALDRADARRRNISVLGLEIGRMLAHVLQHGLRVLEIQQQQPVVVGNFEDQRQHAGLRVVQIQQAAEKQRAHFAKPWRAPGGLPRRRRPRT